MFKLSFSFEVITSSTAQFSQYKTTVQHLTYIQGLVHTNELPNISVHTEARPYSGILSANIDISQDTVARDPQIQASPRVWMSIDCCLISVRHAGGSKSNA